MPVILILAVNTLVQAQQAPQFLMPLYFEDGNGDRDTLYIGYDSTANTNQGECGGGLDTLLGEKWVQIDTTQFNAFFWAKPCQPGTDYIGLAIQTDSVVQTEIQDVRHYNLALTMLIGFTKGRLPLTLKWDKEMFYHEGLPFVDNSPEPKARGQITCNVAFPCPLESDVLLLTDYESRRFDEIYTDSIVFTQRQNYPEGTPLGTMIVGLTIQIVPYNSELPTSVEEADVVDYEIFPNPFRNELTINLEKSAKAQYSIYNISGLLMLTGYIVNNSTSISTQGIAAGVYRLVINSGNKVINQTIIKL